MYQQRNRLLLEDEKQLLGLWIPKMPKKIIRNKIQLLLLIVLLCNINNAFASTAREGENGLVMGLLPFMSPITLFKRFTPLREYISTRLQQEIVFETSRNFESFIARTKENRYDIILTAPHYVNPALDSGDYRVLATVNTPLTANIMVPENSHIQTMHDLTGKIIAHAPNKAFIPIVGKKYILESGLIGDLEPSYKAYRSHNAAYQAVLAGEADAVIIGPYLVKQAIKSHALRLVGKSREYPSIAVLGSTNIANEVLAKITEILVQMRTKEKGKEILSAILCPGFRQAKKNEYDILRTYLSRVD